MRTLTRPLSRRYDFYDTTGRWHVTIALLPILYGVLRLQQHQPVAQWFWWAAAATASFAIFARRPALVRLTPEGICLPEKQSPYYPWDEMSEAHARIDGVDILMSSGERLVISFRQMRNRDIARLKNLIKSQFRLMAQRAAASNPAAQQA